MTDERTTEHRDEFQAADAAFKKRDEHAAWVDASDRDAAVRWHWRGFQDGAEHVRRALRTRTDDEREALLRDLYTLRGWSGGDVVRRIQIVDRAIAALQGEPSEAMVKAVAESLGVHRWKTMGVASLECECGEVLGLEPVNTGDAIEDAALQAFPADLAFRQHLALAALRAAGGVR